MFKTTKTAIYRDNSYITDSAPLLGKEEPDIWISQIGRFKGSGSFRMNYITEYYFCYIIYAGETKLVLDGKEQILKKGDLCFFLPGQHKILEENSQSSLQNIYINLSGRNVEHILKKFGIVHGKRQVFTGSFDEVLDPFVKDVETAYEQENHIPHYPTVAAWRFIELISKELVNEKKAAAPNVAEAARLLLRQEFDSNVSVEEIALRLNVSRVTLFRQFKSKYGLSPKQYLDKVRLHQAVLMLEKTLTPINEIAFHCGYDSPQHFTRMFKRKHSVAPSQYRNSN